VAEAKALFNWNDSHLTIHKGDIISLLQQGDKWWFGELNGQVGVVPKFSLEGGGYAMLFWTLQ